MSILYIRDKNGNFIQIPSIHGKSAYEIAVEKGVFEGTEQEFAEAQVIKNKDIIDQITQENIDKWNSNNGGGMSEEEKEQLNNKLATKFDDVALNEQETNDMQTALDFYADGKVVKTAYFTGGGGGGGATAPYISTTLSENIMVGTGEDFDLIIDFASPNIGKGTLKVFINDVDVMSTSITQGESTTPIKGDLFTKGTNRVVVYVLDRVGIMSNSLTFYIRYGSTELVSDFDQYSAYDYGATIRYYFTPTALDTSLKLTFYMSIDGQVQQGVDCTSDTRGYYTFPSNLSADSHYCEAYVLDSNGVKSNVLAFNLIILSTNTIVVASDIKSATIEEGTQLALDYKVYMNNNLSFITKTYVDGDLINTGTCGLDFNYYRTSSLKEGTHTIKLEVWDVTETYSDYVTWTVTVTESTFETIQPTNAGAMFIATAINKSNTDERRTEFIGRDEAGEEVTGTLYNFAFNSESGWVDDELIISGNSHVEIPIQPLANNARYGFTLDLEFTSRQIGVEDAEVLTLWNEEKDCGIRITTESLILRSAEGNECNLYYSDNECTNVMFIIDRNERKAKIYLNGVMCEAFHLSDYTVDGVPYLEDFTVNSNLILGGYNKNGYSKIRNLRIYSIALTTDEIINNWISCEIDKGKQRELVEFQKGNDLPTMYIYCDFSGLGKDDKKPCRIVYQSTNEEKYGKSFNLDHKQSTCQYQGTSSMAYPIKNYRINLADAQGNKWKYDFPGGQPEHRFTLKADFMNSCHAHNTGMAKFINDNLYNYNLNDEKSMNPFKWNHIQNGGDINDFREAINGFPCRLILVNDGSTPLNEGQNEPTPGNTKDMGIFNFNNDKDATATLGFNSDIFPNCASYEVTANSDISAGAFMSYVPEPIGLKGGNYYNTSFIEWIHLGLKAGDTITITTDKNIYNVYQLPQAGWSGSLKKTVSSTSYSFTLSDNYPFLNIEWNNANKPSYIIINDIKYGFIDVDILTAYGEGTKSQLAYLKESFELRHPDADDVAEDWGFMGVGEEGTGLKALIDWVDNCTDEEFVRDFEQHFHKDYTLRYYALVILCGMVDNMGKNMMLDTADNKIFFPRFYDLDTCLSYDNSGDIKFDVDIEMEQGYWNTSSSRLWTRIRDLMHDDVVAIYNNMRQNGVSYENIMSYMYDEQIAKIPQTYYNKDYDVKYAPFEDSYIGMAHGNGYEHMKRWLKNRFIFCDTLFDYAPSYNNDVLTIRANTTELMNIEIETYTPVYQHVSWYNGQMDKKKIDGKVSTEFSGTAMAATDQEVLIYGGSNVKRIKGISSMNPNQMLIGSATRLIELDAEGCPLLADINSNKANLSPHTYLNKVNLKDCPLLGGNLRLNNSPLIQEVDMRGTAITGLNLPSSIRNLEVLRLPNAITDLTLNDAGILHTLEFDEGVALNSVSMTNCNALENVINFDLLQTPSITLNNSYNMVAELYFRDTTNLSLSNMSKLERVIFTPNNEYETFELINVANAPDYKVTTFNCPKLSTFMTTAPYRESYNNGDYDGIQPNTTFTANSIDISNTQFTDVKLLCTTDTNTLKLPTTVKNFYCDSSFDLDTDYLEDGDYDVVHGELVEQYTTDYEDEVVKYANIRVEYLPRDPRLTPNGSNGDTGIIRASGTLRVTNGGYGGKLFLYDINKIQLAQISLNYVQSIDNYFTYDLTSEYPNTVYFRVVKDNGYNNGFIMIYQEVSIPNIIPSSADGSLIFSMYAPEKTVAPASGTWDLKGLEFFNFHTFGMNNDVKGIEGATVEYLNKTESLSLSEVPFDDYGITMEIDLSKVTLTTNKIAYLMTVGTGTLTSWAGDDKIHSYFNPSTKQLRIQAVHNNSSTTYNLENYDVNTPLKLYVGKDSVCINDTDITEHFDYDSTTYASVKSAFMNLNTIGVLTYNENSILSGTSYSIKIGEPMLKSLTMPARYDDYNITIKNADISPKTHNTMLYPLLVNEDNPIKGILDYTNYAGKHLSWSFAYTDEEYVNIIQPKNELLNSYEYKYNAFYQTDYEFDNPYEIARYTSSASGVLPTFNTEFTYTYDEIDNGDGTYTTKIYADSLDNSPTSIRFDQLYAADLRLLTVDKLKITSAITDMQYMFRNNRALTYINAKNWDVSQVANMDSLFYNCSNLTTIEGLSNWDTCNATNMSNMFYGCSSLTSLDLSNWDVRNVTHMYGTFQNCTGLTSLDVGKWGTSQITNMSNMFNMCGSLTTLDLSKWDTGKVTTMFNMFSNCSKLTELDLSGFDTSNVTDMGYMFYDCAGLTSLDLSGFDTSKVTNIECMFHGCSSLTNLDVSGFITSKVTSMYGTFYRCSKLTNLDVSKFDTSNVTNMENMFNNCSGLTLLDVSGFKTSNVKNMYGMFTNCSGLTLLDVSGFDTSNVTNMGSMFASCAKLTLLDVSGFDTSNVTDMGSMFFNCYGLKSLDVSGLDTSNVTNMNSMFRNSYGLTSLDLSGFITSKVTNMVEMFYNCAGLTSLDLSGFDTSKVTNMAGMFQNCRKLISLNVENWTSDKVNTIIPQLSVSPSTSTLHGTVAIDESTLPSGWVYEFNNVLEIARYTSKAQGVLPTFNGEFTGYDVSEINNNDNTYTVSILTDSIDNLPTSISFNGKNKLLTVDKLNTKNVTNMTYMFYGCTSLTSLDLSGFDTSKVTKMNSMFYNCVSLTSLNLSSFKTGKVTNMSSMFYNCNKLTTLDLSGFDTSKVTDMSHMFYNCENLTSLDLSSFGTSIVTNMNYMFNNCSKLTSLDVSGFDTGKVTSMNSMFYGCTGLTSLNLSKFNTSNVTSMEYTFGWCSGLTSLDLSNFNTSEVTNMEYTFYSCTGLTSINVSNLNTGKVTSMKGIFQSCTSLTSLDLSGFDTSKVKNMASMFRSCTGLTSINVSEFDTSIVTDMNMMFYDCKKLTSLDLSNFNTSKVTDMYYMFNDCSKLIELDSMQNIPLSLDLSTTTLDTTSLLDVIDNLITVTTTKTLTLGSTLLAKLTEDQIAIATNKGWTVA